MAAPTGVEREIYKSPVKKAETRIFVQIDEPTFISPFFEDFLGTGLDATRWDYRTYSWGIVSLSGSVLTVGVNGSAISVPYVASKPRVVFPRSTANDFTLELRMRFESLAGHGNFVMVGSLETSYRPLQISGNTADGVQVSLEGLAGCLTSMGTITSWFRVRLVYDASANTHTLYVDDNDDGVYALIGSGSASNRHPDQIVIGNSVAIQGADAPWSKINVDYIQVTGTSEPQILPDWVGSEYNYDMLGYQDELWAQLPTLLQWQSQHHKRNSTDALTIDLANFAYRGDGVAVDWGRLYSTFNFCGREVRIDTRIGDGIGRWTSWKRVFNGIVDEQAMALSENGDTVLQLRCRDTFRRRAAEHTILVRAYGDDTPPITGVIENKTAAQIIEDVLQNEVGLGPSQFYVEPCAACLKPKTLNVVNRLSSDMVGDLINQLVYCWYPRVSDGKLMIQDYFWGTGHADYNLSTREEVQAINWSITAWKHVAGVVLSIDNSEFQNGGFSTRYPISSLPFDGDTISMSTQIAPTSGCLATRPIQYLAWRLANRDLGAVDVTMECQDWLEQDLEIAVVDDRYLGLDDDRIWIVDGWDYTFSASGFSCVAHLIIERTADQIRDSVLVNQG